MGLTSSALRKPRKSRIIRRRGGDRARLFPLPCRHAVPFRQELRFATPASGQPNLRCKVSADLSHDFIRDRKSNVTCCC